MCDPHRQATRNHTKEGSHAPHSQTSLRYIIMYTQGKREYDNQIDSDTNVMPKDDQDTIQANESTYQVERYTVVSVCM